MLENEVAPQVLQAFKASGCHLWRNNIGTYKRGPYWIKYGVGGKGGSDYLGFLPVRITPEMVGHVLAVFMAPEVKRPKFGRPAAEQADFIRTVKSAGGIAGFVYSWEDARKLVMDFYQRFAHR